MTPALWFVSAVATTLSVVALLLHLVPAYRAFAARRFGHAVWLAMPSDELLASVERRLSRRAVAGALGGLVALPVVVAVLSLVEPPAPGDSDFAATFVLVGGYFAGIAVGSAANALTEPRAARESSVNYARAQAVELSDYVAPIERLGARVAVALSVVLGGVLTALAAIIGDSRGSDGSGFVGSIIIVALGLLSLVLFEVGSRSLLSRGRPASSPTELAWDDALRASALRDLVTAPLALGTYGLLAVGGELANGYGGATSVVGAAVLIAIVVAGFAALVFATVTRLQRYYLRRLWPELAATQDVGA
jgi:hypothetical protein